MWWGKSKKELRRKEHQQQRRQERLKKLEAKKGEVAQSSLTGLGKNRVGSFGMLGQNGIQNGFNVLALHHYLCNGHGTLPKACPELTLTCQYPQLYS